MKSSFDGVWISECPPEEQARRFARLKSDLRRIGGKGEMPTEEQRRQGQEYLENLRRSFSNTAPAEYNYQAPTDDPA